MIPVKKLNKDCDTKLLYQSNWLVENTVHYHELTICPHANIMAPEGYHVSLIVNGVGHEVVPGTYYGDVILTISEGYDMAPHALMRKNDIHLDMQPVAVISDSGTDLRVPDMVAQGTLRDGAAEGVYMGTTAPNYNGIIVTENAEFAVKDSTFDFEGKGSNDFMGLGAGIIAIDKSRVTIEDSSFNFSGVTRCAIHAGGESHVTVNRCDVTNISPDTDWVGNFAWQIALLGTNRLCQLADGATAEYHDCNLTGNGWGITSIDGTNAPVHLLIDRCKMRLIGPRSHGYGAFCIGGNEVVIQDSDLQVNGYPMLVWNLEKGGHPIIRNSKIRGRRFGAMVYGDSGCTFDISGSEITTGKSTLVVKGSCARLNIEDTKMAPGNGTVLQLMDSDECGMGTDNFVIPVGETDTYVEGRDLTAIDPEDDVVLNLKNTHVAGNFYNSTTNFRISKRSKKGGMGLFHDTVAGLPGMDDGAAPPAMPPMEGEGAGGPPAGGGFPAAKDGPKNLEMNLTNSSVEGLITSALQFYREGLREITEKNRIELSDITQSAAPTVNNGVMVSLDGKSAWTVTDTCYLTKLSLAEGAVLNAPEGKSLTMTVDGTAVPVAPGTYQGTIVLTVA